MTSSNGNIFRVTGPLWGNTPVTGEFPSQRPATRGALIFSFICVWINGWVNNREADDLRRHRAHYDVIVMHWDIHNAAMPSPRCQTESFDDFREYTLFQQWINLTKQRKTFPWVFWVSAGLINFSWNQESNYGESSVAICGTGISGVMMYLSKLVVADWRIHQ